jgi:predicted SAM-dependent methyltransferase
MIDKLRKIKNHSIFYYQLHFQKRLKLNIGSAGVNSDDSWLPTDIDILDITDHGNWSSLLNKIRFKNIMAEHVWEHLTEEHTALANKNCYDFLERGGGLRIAVPDGNHPDEKYIEWVRVGGNGEGADDHKILYTYDVMKQKLEKVGFEVRLLEYWDENGKFHYTDWTNEGGLIRRSRRYDERNVSGELKYTSLIVDAIKN